MPGDPILTQVTPFHNPLTYCIFRMHRIVAFLLKLSWVYIQTISITVKKGLHDLSFFRNIYLNVELIIKYRFLRWADHLSGRVLPNVECPVSGIAKQWYGIRSKSNTKKRKINFQLILSRLRHYCHEKKVLLCYVATFNSCFAHAGRFIRTNSSPDF